MQRNGVDRVPPPAPTKRELLFKVLPEITHLHRPEHVQPIALVPLIATAAVVTILASWLALISTTTMHAISVPARVGLPLAVTFQALLGAVLVFAIWFWMELTLIDALLPVSGLAVLMVLVGHALLSRLADHRLALEGKASKSD
jgi:hypothetical protein